MDPFKFRVSCCKCEIYGTRTAYPLHSVHRIDVKWKEVLCDEHYKAMRNSYWSDMWIEEEVISEDKYNEEKNNQKKKDQT